MKIEMGENLFYSWLRHVKECQIVHTNWKVSPQWQLQNEDTLDRLARKADAFFQKSTVIRLEIGIFDWHKFQFHKENAMYAQAAIKPNTLLRNGAFNKN